MTKQEILDYNKRCAKFLNGEYERNENLTFEPKGRWNILQFPDAKQDYDLKFHSDWNWIMKVVEAIEKLTNKDGYKWQILIQSNVCVIEESNKLFDSNQRVYEKTKKEAVVQAINHFLIWYNEQNK